MQQKDNTLDFSNQIFHIGIDVHKKSWNVTIKTNKIVLKTLSMNPSVKELAGYMQSHYPRGKYYSVYEAGFCGYRIHRELKENGFNNIIAAPTEIPTSSSEKNRKSDVVDSRKLARELENQTLKGIYIPNEFQQEIRSLVRMRSQIVRSQARLKNQIKSYLNFYGHKLPENYQMRHWSRGFIEKLNELEFNYPMGKRQLEIYLEELINKRSQLSKLTKSIREYLKQYKLTEKITLLTTIPGIGQTTAVTIFTELMEIERFKSFDSLASYCGLVPSVRSSSETERVLGLKVHHNKYVRELLVEAAWMAIRKDAVLTMSYNEYVKRMSKQEAIIKIAKKLLSRMSYVWRSGNKYVYAVVK